MQKGKGVPLRSANNPQGWFDIKIGEEKKGRITFDDGTWNMKFSLLSV